MHIVEIGAEEPCATLQTHHRRRLHSAARNSDGRTAAAAAGESPASPAAAASFAAVQHFGRNGRTRHFSLSPEPEPGPAGPVDAAAPTPSPLPRPASDAFLLVHHADEARRDEAAQIEKQQLLHALFSSSSSSSSCSSNTAAASSDRAVASPAPSSSGPAAAAAPPVPVPFSPLWYPLATCLSLLLPQHYPHSVTRYYLSYSKWMFVGSAFGTASSVLSMQCLLYSVGVGGAAAVPAAAAIAWVLKDGVGQLGGMLFAAAVSTRFDVSPLRYRFASALVLDASVALEMLTPLAPHLFLPLAALANTGKNIAWLGAAASRASIHRSFLRRENLADVTAKSGSQTILASLVGTAGGIALSLLTGAHTGAILACFAMLSAGHIAATYRALQGVVINQLHARRIRTLSAQFIRQMDRQIEEHNGRRVGSDRATASEPPSFRFNLSTPAMLQRHEPLFLRLPRRASAGSAAGRAHPDAAAVDDDQGDVDLGRRWGASSSVDSSPPFERLVAAVLDAPELHLERREAEQASAASTPSAAATGIVADDASRQRALYERWLSQFDSLPFVASLQLVPEGQLLPEEEAAAADADARGGAWARACARVTRAKRVATALWHRRVGLAALLPFHRSSSGGGGGGGSYAPLVPSSPSTGGGTSGAAVSALLPLPRLHVRLLYKSGCSAEQLLIAPLYTTFVRERWAAAAEAAAAGAVTAAAPAQGAAHRPDSGESPAELARRIHNEALQLLRLDAASVSMYDGADSSVAATSASASACAAAAAHALDSIPTAPRPAPADATATDVDDDASAVQSRSPAPGTFASPAPPSLPSRFVAELQAAGYQTALHFVEDDNPVRIQLQQRLSPAAV